MSGLQEQNLWFVDTNPSSQKDENVIQGKGFSKGTKQLSKKNPKKSLTSTTGISLKVCEKRRTQTTHQNGDDTAVKKKKKMKAFGEKLTTKKNQFEKKNIKGRLAEVATQGERPATSENLSGTTIRKKKKKNKINDVTSGSLAKTNKLKAMKKKKRSATVAAEVSPKSGVPAWVDDDDEDAEYNKDHSFGDSEQIVRDWSSKDPMSHINKSEQERLLEKLVLGTGGDVFEAIDSANLSTAPLTVLETAAKHDIAKCRLPAWQDEDDLSGWSSKNGDQKAEKGKERSTDLRNKYVSLIGNPTWADLDAKAKAADSGDEDDEEIAHKVGDYIVRSEHLEPAKLSFKQCRRVVSETREGFASVRFHPSSQVALVSSINNGVTLYQVDGVRNNMIQHIPFENYRINCAEFTRDGEQFIVSSGNRSFFYIFNMMTGNTLRRSWNQVTSEKSDLHKFSLSPDGKQIAFLSSSGSANFLTLKTNEPLFSLQMNSNCVDAAFSSDSYTYYSHTEDGEVYIWDLRTRHCLHKFHDEGCIGGSALALSPNEQFLACGSTTGVVNLYDATKLTQSKNPKPLKAIMNLTTAVTHLKFNHSSELLLSNSWQKATAVKMFHCRSLTTFNNFPDLNFKIGYIKSLDLSVNSGYLALGGSGGGVSLLRLNHYESY